jgi:hypothetical protein
LSDTNVGGATMLNVIEFRKREPRSSESTARPPTTNRNVDIEALAFRIIGLQSEAKGEIGNAVLMLDLAAQHAREITSRLADPVARKNFDEHVAMIERLLQLAREMAFKL